MGECFTSVGSIYSLTRIEELKLDNKILEKQNKVLKLMHDSIKNRYLPCPDHRDKHATGDECLMCQLERKERLAFQAGYAAASRGLLWMQEDLEKYWEKYKSKK